MVRGRVNGVEIAEVVPTGIVTVAPLSKEITKSDSLTGELTDAISSPFPLRSQKISLSVTVVISMVSLTVKVAVSLVFRSS